MRDIIKFHGVHGTGIAIIGSGSIACRTHDFCNGIAFSNKPVKIAQKVCVELTQSNEWTGAIRIGVTTQDPAQIGAKALPRYACPELTSKPGYWARALSEQFADNGNRITLYVNKDGQLHYFVNNEHKGVLLSDLPTSKTMWLLFDLFGNTTSAKFVSADLAPVEIVARGADAMCAYQVACESGTQSVFRTRLMIVGQDRVGKTTLKRTLMGLKANPREHSTDGIDLSASCSFNTGDPSAWKYALQAGKELEDIHEPVDQSTSKEDDIQLDEDWAVKVEHDYHEALANNIVQELLHRNKQRVLESKSKSTPRRQSLTPRSPAKNIKTDPPSLLDTPHSTPRHSITPTDIYFQDLLHEMPEQVVEMVQEKMLTLTDVSKQLKPQPGNNVELSIWDFAGQAVYYTTHQVFLSSRAVYVIVFNLCQDLDSMARNTPTPFHQLQKQSREDSELSNLDYMDFWMSSIHAHASNNTRNSVENETLSPPIFIVGTHRDSVHTEESDKNKMIQEKFAHIRDYIRGKPYEQHVIDKFYAVESNLEDSEHDGQFVNLRLHIESVASKESYMGEQIPLKWLKFEVAVSELVRQGTQFSSLGQIREVSNDLGEKELATMLSFYHDLGVIVYFGGDDTTLHNTVILKPSWLVNMFRKVITAKDNQNIKQKDLWNKLVNTGLLEEKLVDELWYDIKEQKHALLGLMEKFDLLCKRLPSITASLSRKNKQKSYYVPACIQPVDTHAIQLYSTSGHDVTFYYDFHGFLPDGLFHRMCTRCIRWSLEAGGHEPQLFYRQARFFLDMEHDFVIHMEHPTLARVKVVILRIVSSDVDNDSIRSNQDSVKTRPGSAPSPNACARLRHFLETTLSELRETWMKRISYEACVCCYCEKPCRLHNTQRCSDSICLHFLNLDDCISNKIVCCEHRRIKTAPYRRWFPLPQVKQGPVLCDNVITTQSTLQGDSIPVWVKSAAKLLSSGPDSQDWISLAKILGYKQRKIDLFVEEYIPALALITDWIISSGNTTLSVDMLTSFLEQMQRDDVVDVIQRGQEEDMEPPQVFISYQWDQQDDVSLLRERLESAGYTCWMDIGQMGGGDQLYTRIDEGMRNAKVVIACVSPKYVVSHYCNREMHLADLLRKPIIPVIFENVPWPPKGAMALIFSQLVYVNMKGVGGHGGAGIHADIEDKYQSIMQRLSTHCTPKPQPQIQLVPVNQPAEMNQETDSSLSSSDSDNDSVPSQPVPPNYSFNTSQQVNSASRPSAGRRNTSARFNVNAEPVEPVNVTNCAMCGIL